MKAHLQCCAPIVLTMLALLISPASLSRYVLPSIYLVLPAFGWVIYQFAHPANDSRPNRGEDQD